MTAFRVSAQFPGDFMHRISTSFLALPAIDGDPSKRPCVR